MKRVQAACILQTLIFKQKEDCGFPRATILDMNRREFESYLKTLERTRTRYQIISKEEQEDGSVVVRVRKQYNAYAEVGEYFE